MEFMDIAAINRIIFSPFIFYYSCQVRGMERITENYTFYSANLATPQLLVEEHLFGRLLITIIESSS